MLFIRSRHEPLAGAPWSESAARSAIDAIVADVLGQFAPAALWPTHPLEREPGEGAMPQPVLYNGAAGVLWALKRLHARGAPAPTFDLEAAASELHAHAEHFVAVNESEPASYFLGLSGVRLLQWTFAPSAATADAIYALVKGNLHNKALEALWGSPGTLVAALHMAEATGEARWQALFRRGIDILWEQMRPIRHSTLPDREVWVWTQDLYGRVLTYLGAGHGFAGNLFPVIRGAHLLDAGRVAAFEARAVETLDVAATREAGRINWEPTFDPVAIGQPSKPRVQDCHGAPGIVCRLAGARSPALRAMLVEAGELVWHAGPLVKRPGLCHGTDGNGYAFLKLHTMTGKAIWLDRARAFAMHALGQSNASAAAHGRRVPSLWTGDLGLAIYLQDCLDATGRLPTLDVF